MYHLNEIVELETQINSLRDQIKEKENKIKEYQIENSKNLVEGVIKINECVEIIDNWGNTEHYKDAELYKLLITPEDWTDDQTFISDQGSYCIDDLIGEKVQVGPYIFTIQENNTTYCGACGGDASNCDGC
jgi:hypothetical protein